MALPAFAASSILAAGSTAAGSAGTAAAAAGAVKMSPVLQKLLADILGGTLGGIGSGISQGTNVKRQQEQLEQRGQFIDQKLKPQGEYYQTFKDLPQYDYLAKSLILGGLEKYFGKDQLKQWGIDLDEFKSETGLTLPGDKSALHYFGESRIPVGTLPQRSINKQRSITPGSLGRP